MNHAELIADVFDVFAADTAASPPITLRGGNALDTYEPASEFDAALDEMSDTYLQSYAAGITFLDPRSWRHYLPQLIAYSLRNFESRDGGIAAVIDATLWGLRQPDREPPRLVSLSSQQEAVIVQFLDVLAFSERSAHTAFACQVMEEWWMPDALYRNASREDGLLPLQREPSLNPKE